MFFANVRRRMAI